MTKIATDKACNVETFLRNKIGFDDVSVIIEFTKTVNASWFPNLGRGLHSI